MRRGRLDATYRNAALDLLDKAAVARDLESYDPAVLRETVRLSDKHGLTVYDAAYLELALRHDAPLGTLDDDLRRAAKPLAYEFFRKEWSSRPSYGDYTVEIMMEHVGDPPWLDLDNLAKALLDAIKGYLFHDDSQVARLLVERRQGERERITIRVFPRQTAAG